MNSPVGIELLQGIWDAHQLGEIQSVTTPTRGMINADLAKTLAPFPYMILSFMPGSPIMDTWGSLSLREQERLALSVGRDLALIHDCAFDCFGPLEKLEQCGYVSWNDYIHSFLESDSQEAMANGSIDLLLAERMKFIFESHRTFLEVGSHGRLVHGDFHLDNVLASRDKITAIIDFEYARSGDPAWDFRMEDHWEESCPGSRRFIYEGYAQYRTIAPDHALRVSLYKILYYLDDVLFYSIEQPNAEEHRLTVERLRAVVASF
jgi:Ser/Thr protein kinase RdoA (MazF antagonist)